MTRRKKTIRGTEVQERETKGKDEEEGGGDGMGSKGWDEMEGGGERERERERREEKKPEGVEMVSQCLFGDSVCPSWPRHVTFYLLYSTI